MTGEGRREKVTDRLQTGGGIIETDKEWKR